ncbi:hypothetical protein ACFLWE_01410 [Chloroflexota bacterium]
MPSDVDGGQSVKYVTAYPVSVLIPGWVPPAPMSRGIISGETVSPMRQQRIEGKSLRELAREVGVSYETFRATLKIGMIEGANET